MFSSTELQNKVFKLQKFKVTSNKNVLFFYFFFPSACCTSLHSSFCSALSETFSVEANSVLSLLVPTRDLAAITEG